MYRKHYSSIRFPFILILIAARYQTPLPACGSGDRSTPARTSSTVSPNIVTLPYLYTPPKKKLFTVLLLYLSVFFAPPLLRLRGRHASISRIYRTPGVGLRARAVPAGSRDEGPRGDLCLFSPGSCFACLYSRCLRGRSYSSTCLTSRGEIGDLMIDAVHARTDPLCGGSIPKEHWNMNTTGPGGAVIHEN